MRASAPPSTRPATFLTELIGAVREVHGAGGTLKEAFDRAYAALSGRYGSWPIFEHTLPFDVARYWGGASPHPLRRLIEVVVAQQPRELLLPRLRRVPQRLLVAQRHVERLGEQPQVPGVVVTHLTEVETAQDPSVSSSCTPPAGAWGELTDRPRYAARRAGGRPTW